MQRKQDMWELETFCSSACTRLSDAIHLARVSACVSTCRANDSSLVIATNAVRSAECGAECTQCRVWCRVL